MILIPVPEHGDPVVDEDKDKGSVTTKDYFPTWNDEEKFWTVEYQLTPDPNRLGALETQIRWDYDARVWREVPESEEASA